MRISDWSSDVCSSDLNAVHLGGADMTKQGEPATQPKTAVVLIHGIGEQRPMSTLWGFVDAVWSSDQSLVEPHNAAIYAKPDTINDSFELRRVTTRYWPGEPERRIDFFEFYWPHLMRGNTVHGRSDERREGKELVNKCRSRW